MPITVNEIFESRRRSSTQAERVYLVRGTDDDGAARTALLAQAPASIDADLPHREGDVEDQGGGLWTGNVTWSSADDKSPQPTATSVVIKFSSKGGTQHLTQSPQTVSQTACRSGVTAPDFKGAIGVDGGHVAGVDVPVPAVHFSLSFLKPASAMTSAYQRVLVELVGQSNADAFMFFAAGEVTYLGADWSNDGDDGDYRVDLDFTATANRTDIAIGTATGITKAGSDYLWVLYDDDTDDAANRLVRTPLAVYVERVAAHTNFSAFAIPFGS